MSYETMNSQPEVLKPENHLVLATTLAMMALTLAIGIVVMGANSRNRTQTAVRASISDASRIEVWDTDREYPIMIGELTDKGTINELAECIEGKIDWDGLIGMQSVCACRGQIRFVLHSESGSGEMAFGHGTRLKTSLAKGDWDLTEESQRKLERFLNKLRQD